MIPPINIIFKKRRELGITQKELARLAGVSQSLIAKLESGKIEPSYTKVKAIFDVLEQIEIKKEVFVKEIFNKEVISIQKNSKVSEAVQLMSKHSYSQLPVFEEKRVVGSISEKTILNQIMSSNDISNISESPIWKIMDETFPQIGENTPVSIISNLLKIYPAVLVSKKGNILGIVTKADLLKIIK